MVKLHLFIATLSAACIYLSLTLVFGSAGVQNEQQLQAYRDRIGANVQALRETNAGLEDRIVDLQRDRELLRVYARSLGFFSSSERRLVMDSQVDVTEPVSPGGLVYTDITFEDNRSLLRITAAVIGIGIFGLLTVLSSEAGPSSRAAAGKKNASAQREAA
ncbi:MAG: FtsB family cell division protein [Spirochaetota bacterium]